MKSTPPLSLPLLSTLWLLANAFTAGASPHAEVDFNRDVRPILAQHCFKCHGMDEHGRKGGLRLDVRENALGKGKSGNVAIVAGDAARSELVKRIDSSDEDEVMPPPHTKSVLPDSAKAVLKAWIAAGAQYQEHWAYLPLKTPQIPPSPSSRSETADQAHPIDAFIRSNLGKHGVQFSPEADKHTLVRRVYIDLIGIPPTPAEADAFVNDNAPEAYGALVDRLLASQHYGERWARRWLDLARYADTNGYEKDRPRNIWPYRDWVIRALNQDVPFDEFSIKQLAGDMLPEPTPDDLIATGFHRNTMLNEEGGIDPLEYRYYAMTDRVSVTGTTWLGLTLNCCQCHTHKYDPIQHRDYFGVMALLNNAEEPAYHIETVELAAQRAAHAQKIERLAAELPAKFPGGEQAMRNRLLEWISNTKQSILNWTILKPSAIQTNLAHLEVQPNGFILGSGDVTKSDSYELTCKAPIKDARVLRIEVASHPSLPNDGPGMTYYEGPIGGFFLSEIAAFRGGNRVAIASAAATNDVWEEQAAVTQKPKKNTPASSKSKNNAVYTLDGEMSSGWQVLGGENVRHAAVFYFEEPVDLTDGLQIRMLFEKHFACSLGHFRLSVSSNANAQPEAYPEPVEELLKKEADPANRILVEYFLENAREMREAAAPLVAAKKSMPKGQATLVMRERAANSPRQTHLHHRGEYLQPKELVAPAVPAFLPQFPKNAPANRLTFARWLFSPENPLTARVTVNRHWQAFFGRGLVQSLEDFGYQSEPPSNPELLDWLASEFVRRNWSVKQLHRLIVTSATYKQVSKITPDVAKRDPKNILLARGSRFRLDAEVIRDSALRAAGLLSTKMYGPGVYPPQPASVTTEGTYGKIEWKTSEGEDRYRRTLYTFTKRTAPFAMATTFDAPTGESCLARRDVSNSPLQALTLLNDSMFMEAAQALAKASALESTDAGKRIQNMFRRCATRPAQDEEIRAFRSFFDNQTSTGCSEEAAWTSLARAMLNLDEVITHP
jgi:hypothetical protein